MQLDGCVKRSFAAVESYLRGDLKPERIDDVSIHRSLMFPRKNPKSGHRVHVEDDKTGKVHGVAFDMFRYASNAPAEVVPMEAFCFDPKTKRLEIGLGYLRRLGADQVQMGFLEAVGYEKTNGWWTQTYHDKGIKPQHRLVDSAMASWKFGEHVGRKN